MHTPGPWKVEPGPVQCIDIRAEGRSIARVLGPTEPDDAANAALIAAAPDMLKLLEQIAELRAPALGMSGLQNKIYDLLEKVNA